MREAAWFLLVNPLLLTLLSYCIYDMRLQNTNSRSRGEPFTVTMHLFQDELTPVIFGADLCAVLDYYFANSLLDPQLSCPTCFADMKLVSRPKLSDGYAWHCKRYLCGSRSYHSVRTGSFFAKTHIPLQKYLHVLYLWHRTHQCRWLLKHLTCLVSVCSNTSCSCGKFAPLT